MTAAAPSALAADARHNRGRRWPTPSPGRGQYRAGAKRHGLVGSRFAGGSLAAPILVGLFWQAAGNDG